MQLLLSKRNLFFILLMFFSSFVVANEPDSNNLTQDSADDALQSQSSEAAQVTSFEQVMPLFTGTGFKKKIEAVEALNQVIDSRVLTVLKEMKAGKLYYVKADKQVVYIRNIGDGVKTTSVITEKVIDITDKSNLKKISINNKLRKLLRWKIATLSLKSPDENVRAEAVRQVIKNVNQDSYQLLTSMIATEKSEDILNDLRIGIALWDLNSDDRKLKLTSITIISESLLPEVKNKLVAMVQADAEGQYLEPDEVVRSAASRTLVKINERISYYGFVENLVFGLSTGSILLLIAIGLAITFGVMRVINMAHGELMMLGAYTTYVVQQVMPEYIGLSIFVAIPLAFLVSGSVGVLIERFIVRYLHGRPLDTLLATFGVGLILQQLVRSIFGSTNMPVKSPEFMKDALEFNSVFSITYNRLSIFIFAILVFVALVLILKKTRLGLQVRAVSSNRSIAKAMGIRSEWVDAMTFGLGSGIAGMAGVALSQVTNVGPNLGQQYIIDSFMVVVFGGVGSLSGTFVSGSVLGMLTKLFESWYGAVIASIMVLIFIILFIQKWPRGLFPQKGRAAEL